MLHHAAVTVSSFTITPVPAAHMLHLQDLEAELGSMRLAVAEGQQQRALMPQHQTDGAAAAERLSRILQLEGQLMDMQVR